MRGALVIANEDPALRRLVDHIVDTWHPIEVWLFGSRAEGRARPDSDYDVLVVLPDDTPPERFDPVTAWRLGDDVSVVADVIPCTVSEFAEEKHEIDTLARAAWLRGRRVYER